VLSLEEAAQQPLQLILRTHVPAATLAVSPDGRTVATADRSGHVRRWDLLTHRRVGPTLAVVDAGSHTSTNNPSLAFAPNGRTLAEGTDARLTLWDLATGRAVSLRDRKKHMRGQVRTVAFSADGKTLASAGFDGHVRLWDVKTRQLLARTNASSVPALAFSPDNRTIASGGVDTVFLRDVRTGLLIEPLRLGTTSPVFGLTFNAAGTLASSDFRGVRLWNVRTRSQIARVVYPGRLIFHLALARNGATVAGAADDGTVSMWDTRSGKLIFTSASPGSTTSRTVGFEKDGRLVSLSADGDITVWNGGRPRFGAALPRRVSARSRLLAASPDGRLLVAGGKKGVRFWDLETRKPLTVPRAGATGATALAFSPDGNLLAEAHGREVRLWRAKDLPRLVSAGRARFGGSLDALAFSRDGMLAGGDTDGHVSIWDVRTPGAKPRLVGNGSDVRNDPSERFVYDVAFSADGKLLASGGWDGTLRLWRVRDAAHTTEIGAPDDMQAGDSIRSLAFRPHSRVIAVGSGAGGVSLWDAVGRKELRETTPTGFTAVESVAFTRDGQVLVTAGDDGMLRFWDVRALLPLGYALNGHAGKIRRLALSSDASVLASLGNDGSVKLWPGILWRNDAGLAERICHIVAGGITDVEWETTLRRVSPVTANQPRPRLCGT
jgi:WD40 repeat protein